MLIVIQSDKIAVARYAYQLVRNRMQDQSTFVLGLAAGTTPLLLYREMIMGFKIKELDFSGVHTFNLDEYVGLPPDHPQSYYSFMRKYLFKHVNLEKENIHFLSGISKDMEKHCQDYEKQIKQLGGIDLQILGIGRNGHIGFNEPVSSLCSRTMVRALMPGTIDDNKHFFYREGDVPRWVLTMGIGTILDAKNILLLATGPQKANAVASMVEGPVTSMCPASALQMHPEVTVVCDEAAAAKLKQRELYKWLFENDYQVREQSRMKLVHKKTLVRVNE